MTSKNQLAINTAVGTIFSVSFIPAEKIIKTITLAALGATISLTIALLLHYLFKKPSERLRSECNKNAPPNILDTKSVTFFTLTKSLTQKTCQASSTQKN